VAVSKTGSIGQLAATDNQEYDMFSEYERIFFVPKKFFWAAQLSFKFFVYATSSTLNGQIFHSMSVLPDFFVEICQKCHK
jgi:hypothetical protein